MNKMRERKKSSGIKAYLICNVGYLIFSFIFGMIGIAIDGTFKSFLFVSGVFYLFSGPALLLYPIFEILTGGHKNSIGVCECWYYIGIIVCCIARKFIALSGSIAIALFTTTVVSYVAFKILTHYEHIKNIESENYALKKEIEYRDSKENSNQKI